MRLRTYLQAMFLTPVLLAGCRDANGPSTRIPIGPPAEPAAPPVPPVSSPAQPPAFPPALPSSVVYVEATQLYNQAAFTSMHGALVSRYVLNADGSMGLQFSSARFGFFEYPGSYTVSGDSLTLMFSNPNGPPSSAGAYQYGDTLSVEYNLVMQHSDFMNGLYVRIR